MGRFVRMIYFWRNFSFTAKHAKVARIKTFALFAVDIPKEPFS